MAGPAPQMKKSCDCCKKYVDHLDGKMKCFRRHMTANFRHGMIIPNKFIDHFGGMISRTIELESPNGNMYVVEVSKHMSTTVLRCGWEAFVEAHHIQENDSLLFRHIENSRFEVLVLDSDDCEKVFSCAGIKVTCNVQERGVDYVDISNNSHDDTTKSSGRKRFARCERGNSSHPRKTAKTAAKYSSLEDSEDDTLDSPPEHETSFELDDLQTPSGCDYVLSYRSSLSGAQEKKVATLLQDIQPATPVFVAIMRQSNVKTPNPALVISKRYADEHFSHKNQTVTLQRPGKKKKWHPRFYIRKDRGGYLISGRCWLDFVRDNRVQEADICVFQAMKGTLRKFSLTVHLLRESISHSIGGSGAGPKSVSSTHGKTRVNSISHFIGGSGAGPKSVSSTHGKTRVNSAAPKRVSISDGRTRAKAIPTTRVKEEPDDGENDPYLGCRRSHRARQGPLKSDEFGGPSKPSFLLSATACLTRAQEKKVDERVRAIQSEVPIYVSIMNRSSVGANNLYAVNICKPYATEYLPAREQTVTLLRAGRSKTWEVKMHPRTGAAKMLTGGWRDFVHDNRLQVQDICLFQLMKNERRLTMTVYIIRHKGSSAGE